MFISLFNITYNLNYYVSLEVFDLIKLIDVVDVTKILSFYNYSDYTTIPAPVHRILILENIFLPQPLHFKELKLIFLSELIDLNFLTKVFFLFNIYLVRFFFLNITPTTFWLVPTCLLFLFGLLLLFFIKPKESCEKNWIYAKRLTLIVLLYQFILLYIHIRFFQSGFYFKVGSAGIYNLPYNFNLVKLLIPLLIQVSIYITINLYIYYYKNIIDWIKAEFSAILLFLGFGTSMVFLQNDLFSIFLYFEVISFCIYGLLFLHKRTNAQLHALIWYVLFSLWVSTCYLIGVAFFLTSNNSYTNLLTINTSVQGLFTKIDKESLSNFLLQDFEMLFAIFFIMIYFLFKLGAGPFYTWTVEVYNSCSTGALFIVSLAPKLIYLPMLFFILYYNFLEYLNFWSAILLIIGLLTTFIGSFGILITDKLKEIYAWSSITHTGNMLILLSIISKVTLTFLMFYLVSYFIISFGFVVMLTSIQSSTTGRFIKTVNQLNGVNMLHSNFYLIAIIILASAAGFTPFLSFFMKFSLLTLTSSNYGIFITVIVGLLNIIGSVAYLKMLRNIVGFNLNNFTYKSKTIPENYLEINLPYSIGWLCNFVVIIIIFSFIYYKDFIALFSFYQKPLFLFDDVTWFFIHFNRK